MKSAVKPSKEKRSPSAVRASFRGWPWLAGGFIVILTLLAYAPAMRGDFIWDDDSYVSRNGALRTLGGIKDIWFKFGATPQYYPLVFTTFWIEYRLWDQNPIGYHVNNVLLHGLCAVLLWQVLRRLKIPGAWMAAAIFALHPVHVESVAWITERKNVLSGFFYFLSLMMYMRFSDLDKPAPPDKYTWGRYAASLTFFVCALLSKTVTCSLPAVILLLLWWRRERLARRDILPLLPFFVVGLALAMTTMLMEKYHVGAQGAEYDLSAIDRCLIAGRALWFYAGKLLWPWPLIFVYPRWIIQSGAWWQYLFPAAALAVMFGLYVMRHRWGRGPLVAVLIFAGTLVPALGFINVYPMRYSFVADHFQYLASIGLIVLFVTAIARADWSKPIRIPLSATVLFALGVLTWHQGHIYADLKTLWNDTLAKNPNAWMAHNNLGCVLEEEGNITKAFEHYQLAVQLNPNYVEAHNNMGNVFFKQNRLDAAIAHYHDAIRIKPSAPAGHNFLAAALWQKGDFEGCITKAHDALKVDPKSYEAYSNIGSAMISLGRTDEAIEALRESIRLEPNFAPAHRNLAAVLTKMGKLEEAAREYKDVLRLDSNDTDAHFKLANLKVDLGDDKSALEHYKEAIRLQPDFAEAHNELGVLYARQGKLEQATHHYTQVVRLKPDLADAYYNLGQALSMQGRRDEAIDVYRKLILLMPKDADAHCRLGDVLREQGQKEKAVAAYREALRINPQHATAKQGLAALGMN